MAILDGKVNVIRVRDKNGNLSQDRPIGALAENIAFGGASSNESVEQKINDLISSTNELKQENETLTNSLTNVITTDNKADTVTDTDDESFVTPKTVTDYLNNKTNDTISSTTEKPNNNLVTDNAVFEYVNSKITETESKVPTAAESLDEAQGSNYVTVTLFNSKYISMFEGNLTDDTINMTTSVNPNQVVTYVKNKIKTGAIEENSDKLVTSGTLYAKFASLSLPNKATFISSTTEDNNSYVTPLAVKNFTPVIYEEEITNETGEVVSYNSDFNDNVMDSSSYISPVQAVNYLHTKYIGTVKDVYEERETGETDSDGNPIVENVFKGKKVIHTPLQDLVKTEEEEAALDINDVYFKGFVTPKQVIDYVSLQNTINSGADAALRQYLGITGVDANGNLLPSQGDGKTILNRLNALEEAIRLNTTTN